MALPRIKSSLADKDEDAKRELWTAEAPPCLALAFVKRSDEVISASRFEIVKSGSKFWAGRPEQAVLIDRAKFMIAVRMRGCRSFSS